MPQLLVDSSLGIRYLHTTMTGMRKAARLIDFVAPSGCGKTSVIRRYLAAHPGLAYSISATTRPLRPGEVDGVDYHFLTEESFRDGIARDRFVEWAEVYGHLYGTPRAPLDQALAAGRDVLLDLDVVGSLKLKAIYGSQAITIFLLPPSVDELRARLAKRNTDAPAVQQLRLHNALSELASQGKFDYRVVNDDLDRACREIEAILAQGGDDK